MALLVAQVAEYSFVATKYTYVALIPIQALSNCLAPKEPSTVKVMTSYGFTVLGRVPQRMLLE
jgi:hypothetical protein